MGARLGRYSGATEFSITFDARSAGVVQLTDRITGNFRGGGFYRALFQVNESIAVDMQNAMLRSLRRSINETGRAQRSTRHLEAAIADEQFREVYANTFLVGKSSWMDRSPARTYWRRIEEGDQQVISGRILFANSLPGKLYAPWSPGGVSGGKNGGRNIIRPMPKGYKHAFMPMGRGPEVMGIGPWPAYHYSDAGVVTFRRANMANRYQVALAAIGVPMSEVKGTKTSR